jgi:hypothetical protein
MRPEVDASEALRIHPVIVGLIDPQSPPGPSMILPDLRSLPHGLAQPRRNWVVVA